MAEGAIELVTESKAELFAEKMLGAMWGEEKAVVMLAAAGFKEVEVRQLPHDFMNNFYVARKGAR
jgi:hypothetical protein